MFVDQLQMELMKAIRNAEGSYMASDQIFEQFYSKQEGRDIPIIHRALISLVHQGSLRQFRATYNWRTQNHYEAVK